MGFRKLRVEILPSTFKSFVAFGSAQSRQL